MISMLLACLSIQVQLMVLDYVLYRNSARRFRWKMTWTMLYNMHADYRHSNKAALNTRMRHIDLDFQIIVDRCERVLQAKTTCKPVIVSHQTGPAWAHTPLPVNGMVGIWWSYNALMWWIQKIFAELCSWMVRQGMDSICQSEGLFKYHIEFRGERLAALSHPQAYTNLIPSKNTSTIQKLGIWLRAGEHTWSCTGSLRGFSSRNRWELENRLRAAIC